MRANQGVKNVARRVSKYKKHPRSAKPKAISRNIGRLVHKKGYSPKQAVAIALSESNYKRKTKRKK